MISSLISRLLILFFGTLYPAYASYKAVRTKNVKEYVKWMMYWIVFAFFTCIETFTDIFISWFPFYYEVKVVLVFWLLSPATKGSSTLYRKFVHPMLTRHEQEIDEYLTQATERGYSAVLQLGSKGVNYATNVIMQTAIKTFALTTPAPGRSLQNSQSAGDLSAVRRNQDMMDGLDDWLPRSNSLSGIESYAEPEPQRRGMVIQEIHEEEPSQDAGAARLRDLPARRVQSRRAAAAASRASVKRVSRAPDLEAPVSGTQGVRARRRLREPTPDVDVEND